MVANEEAANSRGLAQTACGQHLDCGVAHVGRYIPTVLADSHTHTHNSGPIQFPRMSQAMLPGTYQLPPVDICTVEWW